MCVLVTPVGRTWAHQCLSSSPGSWGHRVGPFLPRRSPQGQVAAWGTQWVIPKVQVCRAEAEGRGSQWSASSPGGRCWEVKRIPSLLGWSLTGHGESWCPIHGSSCFLAFCLQTFLKSLARYLMKGASGYGEKEDEQNVKPCGARVGMAKGTPPRPPTGSPTWPCLCDSGPMCGVLHTSGRGAHSPGRVLLQFAEKAILSLSRKIYCSI